MPKIYDVNDDPASLDNDEHDEEGVEVLPTQLDLSPDNISELQSVVNSLSESEEFGIDLFMQALQIIQGFTLA